MVFCDLPVRCPTRPRRCADAVVMSQTQWSGVTKIFVE
jgi:hypothetical protein